MQMPDGLMRSLDAEEAGVVRRLFDAGGMVAPVFGVGEEIEIRNARFRVVAIDKKLLVLEGVPAGSPQQDPREVEFVARTREMEALRERLARHGA